MSTNIQIILHCFQRCDNDAPLAEFYDELLLSDRLLSPVSKASQLSLRITPLKIVQIISVLQTSTCLSLFSCRPTCDEPTEPRSLKCNIRDNQKQKVEIHIPVDLTGVCPNVHLVLYHEN